MPLVISLLCSAELDFVLKLMCELLSEENGVGTVDGEVVESEGEL